MTTISTRFCSFENCVRVPKTCSPLASFRDYGTSTFMMYVLRPTYVILVLIFCSTFMLNVEEKRVTYISYVLRPTYVIMVLIFCSTFMLHVEEK